ncbi:MAG: VanW family protein [Defluviitaleaceae bacterium]|nr:VanW family protein [Defluviitaleaceae bacterium]
MLKYFAIVFSGLILTVLIVIGVHYVTVIRFLDASASDLIYSNIYINGVAVGGMSPAEAQRVLQDAAELNRQIIRFVYNDSLVYSFNFTDFGAEYDFAALIKEAFSYGRTGTRRERYAKLRTLQVKQEPHNINGTPLYRYDESTIPKGLEAVRNQAGTAPVSASMRWEGRQAEGGFVIIEGVPGRTPDMQAAAEELRQILANRDFGGQVTLKMHPIPPIYQIHHFKQSQSLLGQFYTLYSGGDETPRSINIRLAASLINNTIVYPGDIFSTREVIGPSTPERGYAMASVIVDGQLVEDYGGGLCQVASALYVALLFAELQVTERANHSLKVYYMDAGFDAAIAGDYMDLKFKNNTEYPVLVVANAQDGILEVHIYGNESRPANRSIAFVSELIETIPPEPDRVLTDDNLPAGYVLINTEPQSGYKYEVFRIIFIDGQQVGRERVNTSTYRPIQGIITKGTSEILPQNGDYSTSTSH